MAEPEPGFLDGVVGFARRAEHPLGHAPQMGTVGLELAGQPFPVVLHTFLPAVTFFRLCPSEG